MNMQTLPTQFLLYDPSYNLICDRYSGFTLVKCTLSVGNSTHTNTIYKLEIAEASKNRRIIFEGKDHRWDISASPRTIASFYNPANYACISHNVMVYDVSGHFEAFQKLVMDNETITHPIHVLILKSTIRKLFPTYSMRRNIKIYMADATKVPTGDIGTVTYTIPTSIVAHPSILETVSPIPLPTVLHLPIIKKNRGMVATYEPLSSAIAKKLLEHAIHTNQDMCPITMDKLTTVTEEDEESSGIAVMPCGHIFSKVAIQECFNSRSTMNKCPQCRIVGIPTII